MKTDIIISHLKEHISQISHLSGGSLREMVEGLAKEAAMNLSKKEIANVVNTFTQKEGQNRPKADQSNQPISEGSSVEI